MINLVCFVCYHVCLLGIFVCSMLFCVLCVFVADCGFSAPNEGMVRFKCRGGKSYALLHIFLRNFFSFLYNFLKVRDLFNVQWLGCWFVYK